APRALTHVTGQRARIADLRRGNTRSGFRQNRVFTGYKRMAAQRIERDLTPDADIPTLALHLVQPFDSAQVNENVGVDDAFLHQAEQIAAAARERYGPPVAPGLAGQRDGMLKVARIGIGKSPHANAPTSLSRRMGRSFILRPVALKI